ncbi:hypothetical protein AX16_006958 [Volvariella volvacea WC 439]|uniref:Ste3-like pheromone receptor 4 n=1 Tax=Volvariella volvacea TaxID=36659 RepID=L7V0R4_9AGAR|nr:Ste3-like pheromone receptor 4 [Volvariella volvacea]KAF8647127.1 hypothetical protein AX16_006958 [Volvariella volvacea WC 439]
MGAVNHAFSVLSFLSFVLVLIPLPWHLEAWNTGTCLYIFWTALGCITYFVNSIIWDGNAINWAPVWCDIVTKFHVGMSMGIPASLLCITRRLYHIACVKTVTTTRKCRRRDIQIDLAIGLGIPILMMPLHYIVQGHRFDIFEDFGCRPHIFNTPPAYPLMMGVPLALCLISSIYSVLCFKEFYKQRLNLQASFGSLTPSRYYRLMAMTGANLLISTPYNLYIIVVNAKFGTISPWISWEDTHFGFSRVDQYPALLWQRNALNFMNLELNRWSLVICAIVFFIFFGFASEAKRHYKQAFFWVSSRVHVSSPPARRNTLASWKIGTTSRSNASDRGLTEDLRFSEALRGLSSPSRSASGIMHKISQSVSRAASPEFDAEKGVHVEKEVLQTLDSVHHGVAKIYHSPYPSSSSSTMRMGHYHPPGLDSMIASPESTPSGSPRSGASSLPTGTRFHEMLRDLKNARDAEILHGVNEDTISHSRGNSISITVPSRVHMNAGDDESFLPPMTASTLSESRESMYSQPSALRHTPSPVPPSPSSRSRALTPAPKASPTLANAPSPRPSERRNRASFPVSVSASTTFLDLTSPPMHQETLSRVTQGGRF